MKKIPFSEVFRFEKKSNRRAVHGKDSGIYPFYSSSFTQNKYTDHADYEGPALIFGSGGKANMHYSENSFSTSGDCLVAKSIFDQVYTKSIYYFLSSNIHLLEAGFKGAGLMHISKNYISELLIPLLPLSAHKRIVTILDKANIILRNRQNSIKLSDELLRATFLNMFGDPIINPKGWEIAPLKNFGRITTGNTPSRKIPEFYGGAVEWIKSDNINTPFHFLTKAQEGLSEEGKKVGRIAPLYSTFVTCIAGSLECIGNAALSNREVAFNQQINAITPGKNTDPFFLYCMIKKKKKKIQNNSTNSMKGMLSKGKFEQITFLKPPLKLQKQFGSFFKKYMESLSNIRKLERIGNDLFNSLTQRAFRGLL